MPYISDSNQRSHLSNLADVVVSHLKQDPMSHLGNLNFFMSTLLGKLYNQNKSYIAANQYVGLLECVKLEMYRRSIARYENQKMKENGDIEVYSDK